MSAVIPDQQTSPSVAEFYSPGPGERLRAARLSMGFDLAKIASELHLTSDVVERLEADHYDGIGARVFVRGYLRNYARIVEMPVDSILRQFDEKWPDDSTSQSMLRESPRLPADGGPSRGWAGAVTWLLVVGLLALFLMWWRGYLDGLVPEQIRSTATEGGVQTVEPGMSDETGDAAPFDDGMSLPGDGRLRLPSVLGDGTPTDGEIGQLRDTTDVPPEQSVAAEGGGDTTTGEPAAASFVSSGTPPAAGRPVADTSPPAAGPAPAGATPLPTENAGSPGLEGGAPVFEATTGIVMTFSGPCWVDVRDSTRKFKLFGEMPKGTRKVLGGEPPYKMIIGNSRAVSIEVNGEPFDIMPYAKGNVARFTLEP